MWKPNPQPSRTNVMTGAVGCGRTDESREACAFIENDDASTPQARTNDNLLNMDKTSLLTVSLGCAVGNGSTRRRFCHRSFRGRRGSPPRRDNKKSADRSRRPSFDATELIGSQPLSCSSHTESHRCVFRSALLHCRLHFGISRYSARSSRLFWLRTS